MPLAEKSIINPGTVTSKSPLKKSTVFYALSFLGVLILAGYYLPRIADGKAASSPPSDASTSTRLAGTERQIESEQQSVLYQLKSQKPPAPTEPVPAENGPLPPSGSPIPELKKAPPSALPVDPSDLELDAAARASKSVAYDSSSSNPGSGASAANPSSLRDQVLSRLTPPASAEPTDDPAANRAALMDSLSKMQAGAAKAGDQSREWIKEFKELKPSTPISAKRIRSPFTLIQSKTIPAVLVKRINSDLPGSVTAMVTQDIYDSLSGANLLFPMGTQLIGEYSNSIKTGQSRVLFAFSRMVLPNGLTFDLPGNKGEDQLGQAGVAGDVNNHYFSRFSNAFMIAILASKADASVSSSSTTNIGTSGPSTAAGKVLSDIASSDLTRTRDISPTITIAEGTRINVEVAADMEFPGPYKRK
jgi:type IV secretory pathway VirB10-like protein